MTPESFPVYSGGLQVTRQLKKSKSSIESGIYLNSKAVALYQNNILYRAITRNISIPINYRFDTKIVYIAAGPFIDYLVREDFSHWEYKNDYSRKFNVGFNLNLGIEKSISKLFTLMVEGRYSTPLSSARTGRGFFGSSYVNYGFAVGVNYKLLRNS